MFESFSWWAEFQPDHLLLFSSGCVTFSEPWTATDAYIKILPLRECRFWISCKATAVCLRLSPAYEWCKYSLCLWCDQVKTLSVFRQSVFLVHWCPFFMEKCYLFSSHELYSCTQRLSSLAVFYRQSKWQEPNAQGFPSDSLSIAKYICLG